MQKKKINIFLLINFICIIVIVTGIILCLMPLISISATESAPKFFGNSLIKIESDNMLPEFENNEILAVNEIDPAKIKAGDKIAYFIFNEDGKVVQKEFSEVLNIFTNSDNEYLFEAKATADFNVEHNIVHQDSIIGKYNDKAVFLASLFTFSTSTLGILLLIILPVILLTVLQIIVLLLINIKKREKLINMKKLKKEGLDG